MTSAFIFMFFFDDSYYIIDEKSKAEVVPSSIILQLEFHDINEIKVIRRYDMAHGKPHVDKYNMPDPKTGEYKKIFFNVFNIKECLSSAINYLKENYILIIERYFRKHKDD